MLLIVYGTRPEYIKLLPIMDELTRRAIKFKTVFTGQHTTLIESQPDTSINIESRSGNRLNDIVSTITSISGDTILDNISHIMVHGDTTSAMSFAIYAMNNRLKLIHLEAGLRSNDRLNPYPEENNRRIISSIADIHLCPTEYNKVNLMKENISDGVYVVGNTGLDNIDRSGCEYGDTILVTLHRRENHDILDKWFITINELAKSNRDLKFVIPIHPNPNVMINAKYLTDVEVVKPMTHEETIDVIKRARLVITDSGGIQEECSYLDKKCIVCRVVTERPEAVGSTSYMCESPDKLKNIFDHHIKDYMVHNNICPFGNGDSSKLIADILERELHEHD